MFKNTLDEERQVERAFLNILESKFEEKDVEILSRHAKENWTFEEDPNVSSPLSMGKNALLFISKLHMEDRRRRLGETDKTTYVEGRLIDLLSYFGAEYGVKELPEKLQAGDWSRVRFVSVEDFCNSDGSLKS